MSKKAIKGKFTHKEWPKICVLIKLKTVHSSSLIMKLGIKQKISKSNVNHSWIIIQQFLSLKYQHEKDKKPTNHKSKYWAKSFKSCCKFFKSYATLSSWKIIGSSGTGFKTWTRRS